MEITARKAYLQSAQYYLQNWQDVVVLAAKLFILMTIINFSLGALIDAIFGTRVFSSMTLVNFHSYFSSMESVPPGSIATHGIIEGLTYSWFIPLLIISISRNIIMGDKFNTTVFKRLTQKRSLKLAFLMIILSLLSAPTVIYLPEFHTLPLFSPPFKLIAASFAFLCILVSFRLYYLQPLLAMDRTYSTIGQYWQATRGTGWLMFKMILLISVFNYILDWGIVGLIHLLGNNVSQPVQAITFVLVGRALFTILLDPLFIGGLAYIYKTLEEQHEHDA